MYNAHPDFIPPENKNQVIWRYMNILEFYQLIQSKSLYFSAACQFQDRFEGSYTKKTMEHDLMQIMKNEQIDKNAVTRKTSEESQSLSNSIDPRELRAFAYDGLKKSVFASCWFMDDQESDAMWKLYLGNKDGIAIKSSYKRLIDSFEQDSPDIYVGKIQYIDYINETMPGPDNNDIFSFVRPFMYKRSAFKHEQELRAMFHELPARTEGIDYVNVLAAARSRRCTGKLIPVDLKTLIDEVYIPPMSSPSLKSLIELILNSSGLDSVEVKCSSLDEDPVLVFRTMSQSLGWE